MRILSCDGGGIRGVLPAVILRRLDDELGLVGSTDLFAGTSTGAIVATMLASGKSTRDVVDIYETWGAKIFASRDWLDSISGADEYWRANYQPEGLREALEATFGDQRLGDLNKLVVVPAFDLKSWKVEFYHNWPDSQVLDLKLVDLVLRTTAAPTYFPPHQLRIDGGVFANNPADVALAMAHEEGVPTDELIVLSLGTGAITHQPPAGDSLDWGYKQWLPLLLWVLFDGAIQAAEFRVNQVCGARHHRLNPVLPRVIDLGDHECTPELEALGEAVDLTATLEWLRCEWECGSSS